MSEPSMSDVLVAVGRLEEMMKAMNDKLDRLESTTERHWKKISEIETEIALLKQRVPEKPRIHWTTWIVAVIAALGFIAAYVQYITN